MDTSSAIIGAILLAAIIFPILIISRNIKKRNRARVQALQTAAARSGAVISEFELMNLCSIGIAAEQKLLYFAGNGAEANVPLEINLKDVAACRAGHISRKVGANGETRSVTDKLEIQLVFHATHRPPMELALFDASVSMQMNDELMLLDKWVRRINEVRS